MRDTLRRLIESEGFRVETFAAANEFLNRTAEQGPACLILDMQMPGMNGPELQARIPARGANLPVIIITRYRDVRS
ncbi:MAG: response regulator, partial [Candidatus Hydrogenedentes bacterium]|nr:response regulator [Candidatus Hydrogenedentota bacterium]